MTVLLSEALSSDALSQEREAVARPAIAEIARTSKGPVSSQLLRRLARSRRSADICAVRTEGAALPRESGRETWLRQRFALRAEESVAASVALGKGNSPGALVVRLVHLHAGLDHLTLSPFETLQVSESESRALFEDTARWLATEPVTLRWLEPDSWELLEHDPERSRFLTLSGASMARAAGRNIDIWLPAGPSAREWRRLMNEVQMLWHDHPVNQDRASRGLPAVNALWLEGTAASHPKRSFDWIISDDQAVAGLARATGAHHMSIADATQSQTRVPEGIGLIDLSLGTPPVAHTEWSEVNVWSHTESRLQSILALNGLSWNSVREMVLTGEFLARTFTWSRWADWRLWRRHPSPDDLREGWPGDP